MRPRRPPRTDTPPTSATETPQPSETATEVANNSQDPDPEYVFDKLLEHDFSESVPRYLVKWNGYPTAEATWEPRGHIPFNAVSRYHHKHKLPLPKWYPDPTHNTELPNRQLTGGVSTADYSDDPVR